MNNLMMIFLFGNGLSYLLFFSWLLFKYDTLSWLEKLILLILTITFLLRTGLVLYLCYQYGMWHSALVINY